MLQIKTDFMLIGKYTDYSLNKFIAKIKQGVGPPVFPTLVMAIPLDYNPVNFHTMTITVVDLDVKK